jgi:hypothetical protein
MERHDLDPISLVFGLAFTILGLLSLVRPLGFEAWQWVPPLLAVGLGLAVLFSTRSSRREPPDQTPER